MLSRPPSSPAMAMRKPMPSAPILFSAGMRQSSKITARVGWAFQPILRSFAPKERPGVPPSTTKVEMPPGPSLPVRAMIKHFRHEFEAKIQKATVTS